MDEDVFLPWLDEHTGDGDWLKGGGRHGDTPLQYAVDNKDISAAVTLALLAACPGAAKVKDGYGNNPLHDALGNKDTTKPVVSALFAAYPGAVKDKNNGGMTPLDCGILPGIPADVVAEYRRNLLDHGAMCMSYLREGKHLDAADFFAWFDAHKGDGEWLKVTDQDGYTPLHHALKIEGIPVAVSLAIIHACPEADKIADDEFGSTLLNSAVLYNASAPVVAALIAVWPGAIKEVDEDGNTPLHSLANADCSTLAERRRTNIICFILVKHRASLAVTNDFEQTPAAAAAASETPHPHLIATLREITLFKKHTHLSWIHFRDWTTVSHAWCTPSAKLVALTVLMVGETYKRELLPRLPMDCWYRILNCIPRHELRLGGCEPTEEQAALVTYVAILREARMAVVASDAAAVASTAVAHA